MIRFAAKVDKVARKSHKIWREKTSDRPHSIAICQIFKFSEMLQIPTTASVAEMMGFVSLMLVINTVTAPETDNELPFVNLLLKRRNLKNK